MCLKLLNSKKKTKEFKDSIPPEGITVYKIVCKRSGKYYPLYQNADVSFVKGPNNANITTIIAIKNNFEIKYRAGYHFWLEKEDAVKYKSYVQETDPFFRPGGMAIIECIVKKSWITTTGMNTVGKMGDNAKTIVTKKAIFPECEGK